MSAIASSAEPAPKAVLAVLGLGVIDPDTPVARADDAGLTRGDGCFEGTRVRTDPNGVSSVDTIDSHLARMARSAAALDIAFDARAWQALIGQALAAWTAPGEATMKLLLTRGPAGRTEPTGFAWIRPMPVETRQLRLDGLKVITLSRGFDSAAFAAAPWLLGGVKSLSYAVNMAAQRAAERVGADDVIFLGADGVVLEAPTASVVWAVGDDLHTTPTGATGILAGTTQRLLFERAAEAGWRTRDTLASIEDLHAADAVWLVSSGRGPIDVIELDGRSRVRLPAMDARIRRLAGF